MYTYKRQVNSRIHSTKNVPGAILARGIQWTTWQLPAFLSLLEETDLYKICYTLYITCIKTSGRDIDYEEK